MKELLKNTKDFKIIPNNFKNSGELVIQEVNDKYIKAKLILENNDGLSDYTKGENVEIFGVNDTGLIYLETEIIDTNNDIIILDATKEYSIIQRREYSRVKLEYGEILFKDMPENIIVSIEDISAGGVKLITNTKLKEDVCYDIEIKLSGNMRIECSLQPIRVAETKDDTFSISGKFVNLENIDRIVLVQYVFKKKMETQDIKIDDNE